MLIVLFVKKCTKKRRGSQGKSEERRKMQKFLEVFPVPIYIFLMKTRFIITSLFFLLCIEGCAPLIRPSGYHENPKYAFHKTIQVSLTVHIVGNRNQFPVQDSLRKAHPNASGWAYPHEIWVLGYRLPDGTIRLYHELLGHEFAHVLNWRDAEIENPDHQRPLLILR